MSIVPLRQGHVQNGPEETLRTVGNIALELARGVGLRILSGQPDEAASFFLLPEGVRKEERGRLPILVSYNQNGDGIVVGYLGSVGTFAATDRYGNISQLPLNMQFLVRPDGNEDEVPRGYPERWPSFRDKDDRRYLIVPANDGFIPVRHGTDPSLGNWLSLESRTQIVYDAYRFRHPACENIDYASHGFRLYGKSWWPVKLGEFNSSFKRIQAAYYPEYNRSFVPLERAPTDYTRLVVGFTTLALGSYVGAPPIIAAGEIIGHNFLAGALGSLPTAAASQQVFGALSSNTQTERLNQDQRQLRHNQDSQTQIHMLNSLAIQDSSDFMIELIRRIEINQFAEALGAFLQENRSIEMHVSHRGEAVVRAARSGNRLALRWLLLTGAISHEHRGQALVDGSDRGDQQIIQALLENDAYVPIESRGLSCKKCAAKDNHQILRILLLGGSIKPQDRGEVLIESAKAGAVECGRILLGNRIEIASEHWFQALMEAINQEHVSFIDLLFGSNPHLLLEQRGQAAICAANRGQRDILQKVVASGPIAVLHQEQIRQILTNAALQQQQIQVVTAGLSAAERNLIAEAVRPQSSTFTFKNAAVVGLSFAVVSKIISFFRRG